MIGGGVLICIGRVVANPCERTNYDTTENVKYIYIYVAYLGIDAQELQLAKL